MPDLPSRSAQHRSSEAQRAWFLAFLALGLVGLGTLIGKSTRTPDRPTLSLIEVQRPLTGPARVAVNFENRTRRSQNFFYSIRTVGTNGWQETIGHDPNARIFWNVGVGSSQLFHVLAPPVRGADWQIVCEYQAVEDGPVSRWGNWLFNMLGMSPLLTPSRRVFLSLENP